MANIKPLRVGGVVLLVSALLSVVACQPKPVVEMGDESERLFRDSTSLASTYADSITAAADSAEAQEIYRRFGAKMDSLNFSVPADTDLLLTEGENDTLVNLILGVRKALTERLRCLGEKGQPTEGTENDD